LRERERAEQERQRTVLERERAELERQRAERLVAELEEARRPWWRKMFGR
jgi:antirestriction protein ArdC